MCRFSTPLFASLLTLVLCVNPLIGFAIRRFSSVIGRKQAISPSYLYAQLKDIGGVQNPKTSPLLDWHPLLVRGTLENGLEYLILPNESPRGRFESYLEILSGSVDELDSQQGMAHVVEHVAYMGSRNRILLGGTGKLRTFFLKLLFLSFIIICASF